MWRNLSKELKDEYLEKARVIRLAHKEVNPGLNSIVLKSLKNLKLNLKTITDYCYTPKDVRVKMHARKSLRQKSINSNQ